MNNNIPIVIQPLSISKPWGGDHLNLWNQKQNKEMIGELILISCIKKFPTYVEIDNVRQTFQNYWKQEGQQKAIKYGSRYQDGMFPLLLKILSTKEPLSLQVHPSTEDLKEKFNKNDIGKFESWVILDADDDAKIYFGLKDEYNQNDLIKEHKNILNLFNTFQAKQGDLFKLEPGLIHGTQNSLIFFEIQQPSDYTFRIHDFGRGRKLHLEEAQKVIKKNNICKYDWSLPLKSKYFSLKILKSYEIKDYEIKKPYEIFTYFGPPGYFVGSFESLEVKWGSTLLFWRGSSISFVATSTSFDFKSSEPTEAFSISFKLPLMDLDEARFFISSE